MDDMMVMMRIRIVEVIYQAYNFPMLLMAVNLFLLSVMPLLLLLTMTCCGYIYVHAHNIEKRRAMGMAHTHPNDHDTIFKITSSHKKHDIN